jgi:hypothetical protein
MRKLPTTQLKKQRGAAAVEFAIISLLFFTILFAIFEFGRLLYVYNTMQEVTRRAAREAVVRWITDAELIKTYALFGGTSLPAGAEITTANINIEYIDRNGTPVTPLLLPEDPGDNLSACSDITRTASCIFSVRVSINNARYRPMVNLFSFLDVALPRSTVTLHAESLGFAIN